MASAEAVRRGKSKVSRAVMEAVESRTMMAIVTNGPAGVLGSSLLAVESASATPDIVNQYRYATTVAESAGSLVTVTGDTSSGGNTGMPVGIGGNINTDVASNFPGNRAVVTYAVFTRTKINATPGPGGNPEYFVTDTQIYADVFVNGVAIRSRIPVNVQTDVATVQDPDLPTERDPRIAMDASGNFVVVWESDVPGQAVMARQYNADGSVGGDPFLVSATGAEPDVARNSIGNYVIGYTIPGGLGAAGTGTYIRAYNAGGVATGNPVRVSTAQFSEPAVGIANNGRYIVAWATGDGIDRRVVVQRYASDLSTIGNAFSASSENNTAQTAPQLAVDIQGGFAVGWATAVNAERLGSIGFRLFSQNAVARAPDTTIGDFGGGPGTGGVLFLNDHRFGLAYRIPGTIHIAYNEAPTDPAGTTGRGLMQTYNDTSVVADEIDVPSGAYLIDLSSYPGVDLLVSDEGNVFAVTINGTTTTHSRASSIYVRGSEQADRLRMALSITVPVVIYGRGGRDTIVGGQNNDTLDGGAGGSRNGIPIGNVINGSAGDDEINGGGNLSTVFGGAGNDIITAGLDGVIAYGEDGNDTLIGGEATDALEGAAGNDSITGGSGGDNIDGGAGNDILFGEDGRDYIFGGNGNDYINGGLDGDYLNGGRGMDRMLGEGGRDTILGGAEADYLRGGGGAQQVSGNPTDSLDVYYYDTLDELSGRGTRLLVP